MKLSAILFFAALSCISLGQGTQAVFNRDFRVTTVPRLSGFSTIDNPAVNKYGDCCCTNIASGGDQAAAVCSYLGSSAVEYQPLSGGTKCGAIALNDGSGNPRIFRVVGWSETSSVEERPCSWDPSSSPTGPGLPANTQRGRFLSVNNSGAACGLVKNLTTSPEQPVYWSGSGNITLLPMPANITINGSTYSAHHGRANWIDDNGVIVGTVYFDGTGGDAGERPVIWEDTAQPGVVLQGWDLTKTGQANWVGTNQGDPLVEGTETTGSKAFTWTRSGSTATITTNRHCNQNSMGLANANWQYTTGTTIPYLLGQGDEPFLANTDQDSFTRALNAVTLPGSSLVDYATQFRDADTSGYSYFAGATPGSTNVLIGKTYQIEYSGVTSLTKILGIDLSGGSSNLGSYDDSAYNVKRALLTTPDGVIIDVEGDFSAAGTINSLACSVISKMSAAGVFSIRVDYYNWATSTFDSDPSSGTVNTCYSKYAPLANLSAGTYVSTGGIVKARIRVRNSGLTVDPNNWSVFFDRVSFYINMPS